MYHISCFKTSKNGVIEKKSQNLNDSILKGHSLPSFLAAQSARKAVTPGALQI